VCFGNVSGLRIVVMEKLDGYLRIKEAAEYLGVSPNTLRNWGREGKILEHRHPVNNYRLYKEKELAKLLKMTERTQS
jgi:excisionase family DNA binding protein